MTSHAINGHEKQASVISEVVWFEGDTALLEGQGVCYNWDSGTAAAKDGRRSNRVEVPSILNAQYFAGVTDGKYAARTGGQLITIFKPGSWCNVLSRASTVIGVGRLTCEITAATATNGSFRYSGLEGEGSCVPFQTIDRSGTAGVCFCKLDAGRPSGLCEVIAIVDNDAIGTVMVGGTTFVTGATIAGGDCTYTLPDATRDGLRKKIKVITTEIATNDLVVTVTTGRSHALADSDLATVTFAGASTTVNTQVTLEWDEAWIVTSLSKTMPALA